MDYIINELFRKGFIVSHFQIVHKHAMDALTLNR